MKSLLASLLALAPSFASASTSTLDCKVLSSDYFFKMEVTVDSETNENDQTLIKSSSVVLTGVLEGVYEFTTEGGVVPAEGVTVLQGSTSFLDDFHSEEHTLVLF